MPTLVIKNPDESLHEQDIGAELTVGRGAGNGLVLSEGGVSRKHARFWLQDDGVWVEDLGSANGTWVDGQPIEGPTLLSIKSQVVIGDYEVQLKVGSKTLKRVERKQKNRLCGASGQSPGIPFSRCAKNLIACGRRMPA